MRQIIQEQIGSCPHRDDSTVDGSGQASFVEAFHRAVSIAFLIAERPGILRPRALVVVHAPQVYAPTRVQDAAAYLLRSPSAAAEGSRLATDAIERLRSKRGEPKPATGKGKAKRWGVRPPGTAPRHNACTRPFSPEPRALASTLATRSRLLIGCPLCLSFGTGEGIYGLRRGDQDVLLEIRDV